MRFKLLILFTGLLMTNAISAQDSLKYVALTSVVPTEDNSDLRQLDSYFENVRLVGMGESTHGTHEFATMRQRIFEYLVRNKGFNTFFLEADYATCLRTNAYIHGADDDVKAVVDEIGLWPWETTEMVDVVNWMREYNSTHTDQPLDFIGVDAQEFASTLKQIDRILAKYNLPVTDTTIYKPITDGQYMRLKKKKDKAPYSTMYTTKEDVNTDSFSAKDKAEYANLVRHFRQIIEYTNLKKDDDQRNMRDVSMAKNALFNLDSNPELKGIYWAHDGHVSKVSINKFGTKRWFGTTGGYLENILGDTYFCMALDFDEGSFNAYYPDTNSDIVLEKKAYTLGEITVGPSAEGTFGAYYRKADSPVFVYFDDLPKDDNLFINDIGAAYYPSDDTNRKSSRYNLYRKNDFDAYIIIPKTTATHLLGRDG